MNRRANQEMRKKNENVKKQNDMIEQMENSRSDEVENEDVLSSHHGTNHSKAISYNDEEISCEISDTDITDTEQSPSFTTSKINRSTISTSVSEKTTINEINEIVKEILSKIQQNTTLTNERLNRIKRYFTESKILTSYESDAFKWITDNVQSIYSDPINAYKKLRIAIGNRNIPTNIAIKGLRLFIKNHTIDKNDMKKYCYLAKRNEITINELSEILKHLIKMKIKHIIFDESNSISTTSFQQSSHAYQF